MKSFLPSLDESLPSVTIQFPSQSILLSSIVYLLSCISKKLSRGNIDLFIFIYPGSNTALCIMHLIYQYLVMLKQIRNPFRYDVWSYF
jgi:hypothetical protein